MDTDGGSRAATKIRKTKAHNHEIHENHERKQQDKVVGWVERRDCVVLSMKTSPTPVGYDTVSQRNPSFLGERYEYETHESPFGSPQFHIHLRG